MRKNTIASKFSGLLFWDTDLSAINKIEHRDFIIKRVLLFGDLKDWQLIKKWYGIPVVKKVLRSARGLDIRSRNFWQTVLN